MTSFIAVVFFDSSVMFIISRMFLYHLTISGGLPKPKPVYVLSSLEVRMPRTTESCSSVTSTVPYAAFWRSGPPRKVSTPPCALYLFGSPMLTVSLLA